VTFFMEIIVLMTWSIWTTRNDWVFDDIHPSVQRCKDKFVGEFSLLLHRIKPDKASVMNVSLQTLYFALFLLPSSITLLFFFCNSHFGILIKF
jgi:hypothetical protein